MMDIAVTSTIGHIDVRIVYLSLTFWVVFKKFPIRIVAAFLGIEMPIRMRQLSAPSC